MVVIVVDFVFIVVNAVAAAVFVVLVLVILTAKFVAVDYKRAVLRCPYVCHCQSVRLCIQEFQCRVSRPFLN